MNWQICKNIILQSFIGLCCAVVCAASVGCKEFDEPAWEEALPDAPNIAIADLHSMITGRTVIIEQDIVIGGYVTSSDEASNFYRTLTIEDSTGGVEIMVGLYDTHNIYPKGYYLTVNLNSCAVAEHYGVMQVGMPTAEYSYYPTDYFASRAIVDKHIKRYDKRRDVSPKVTSIANLTPADCGRLVNIGGITVQNSGVWEGYSIFADKNGNKIALYTSEYADYAQNPIPTGAVSITGILQYGKVDGEELYIIKMRDEKDCNSIN